MKTNKALKQIRETKEDRLSALPDSVLLHVMGLMETVYAVRTCVLSRRWKDLWKHLTSLSFGTFENFVTFVNHDKFVDQVLSHRDDSFSLLNLHCNLFKIGSKALNKVLKYAVSHNVQRITINATYFEFRHKSNIFLPLISCQSLSCLHLYVCPWGRRILKLPKSLQLPALQRLYLDGRVSFIAGENECAEPFSNCNLLNTLLIKGCFLHNGAKFLNISNVNLSSLKLQYICHKFKIVLSTPNLNSLTIEDLSGSGCHKLSSTCNLSFLDQVNIDVYFILSYPIITDWLQMFANVKILSLSFRSLETILYVSYCV